MANRQNVILCGFMGCGKTTLGPLLAQGLKASFVDADDEIQAAAGQPIPEIFAQRGESGFRELEHQVLVELLRSREGMVLSTGGGVCTYPPNREPLKKGGTVIFLNPGFSICYKRIVHSDRPVVRANTKESLEELYNTRLEGYRWVAHHELRANKSPDRCVEEILRLLKG